MYRPPEAIHPTKANDLRQTQCWLRSSGQSKLPIRKLPIADLAKSRLTKSVGACPAPEQDSMNEPTNPIHTANRPQRRCRGVCESINLWKQVSVFPISGTYGRELGIKQQSTMILTRHCSFFGATFHGQNRPQKH